MPEQSSVWFPMFTPDGGKANFTIVLGDGALTIDAARQAFTALETLKAAGFLVREPGLEDGEQSETVHYVARRAKANDDGTETPVIDVYPEQFKWRVLSVYLNTPDDVAAFEAACGVRLADLPEYIGAAAIERGQNAKLDREYVRQLPRPAVMVWKHNPHATDDNKKPKRKFVRWQSRAVDTSTGELLGNDSTPRRAVGLDLTYVKQQTARHFSNDFNWQGYLKQLKDKMSADEWAELDNAKLINIINDDRAATGKAGKGWYNDSEAMKALNAALKARGTTLEKALARLGWKLDKAESADTILAKWDEVAAQDAQLDTALGK